jgi:hypothetical protein
MVASTILDGQQAREHDRRQIGTNLVGFLTPPFNPVFEAVGGE